ncbi:hypothetical protein JK628_22660 [Shewanella sp. KX20019]|uniref:hypothetical protein n=1 Tax=Shewanella sp. KX20019 TaxID=2803864 RepID=UPI00192727D1|nr:hypothetical protein [Shewanella sp. KX20019]QQX80233.1 hypothetical protein JK628_22660 [Shewanella sp. KX20019]
MNSSFITSGKWLKGSVRLWLFDLGCASFLGVGLLGLVMALGMPFLLPDDAERKIDTLLLLMNMFVASTCVAIGWQMNRLAATEWAEIVPQYRQSVLLQALALLVTSLVIAMIFLLAHNALDKVDELLLTLLFGFGFLYFSLKNSSAFHLSFVLYVSLPMQPYLAELLPQAGTLLLLFVDLILAMVLGRKLSSCGWNSKARVVYLNGLEMGWFWLPTLTSSNLLNRLERFLHPANYFIGPMLTMMLLAMPVVTLLLALGAYLLDVQLPVLFLLIQFSGITCAMLHWSRIQRWRAVESLFVLPGFDGKRGMVNAFMLAQYRLLAILTVTMMVTATLVSLLSPLVSLSVWLHLVLSNVIGCAFILGLGSMCRTSMQISATIFLVALLSGWVSSSLSTVQSGGDIWHWIAWDIPLLILALLCLWYAKYRLWRGDLLSS